MMAAEVHTHGRREQPAVEMRESVRERVNTTMNMAVPEDMPTPRCEVRSLRDRQRCRSLSDNTRAVRRRRGTAQFTRRERVEPVRGEEPIERLARWGQAVAVAPLASETECEGCVAVDVLGRGDDGHLEVALDPFGEG